MKEKEIKTFSYVNDDGILINYFVGNEITKLLGYKNSSEVISQYVSDYNKLQFRNFLGEKTTYLDPRIILINNDGVNEIFLKSKKNIPPNILSIINKYEIKIKECKNQIKNNEWKDEEDLDEEDEEDEEDDEVDDEVDVYDYNDNEIKYNSYENELIIYSYVSNSIIFEYFVGFQITALLGYKNPTEVIKNNVSKCNRIEFKDFPGVKIPNIDSKTHLITHDGAVEILLKTRKLITPDVLHILKKFNIDPTNRKVFSKEQHCLLAITNTFKTEKYEDQFKVGKYYIDLYFTEFKIAIEVDENGHSDRKPHKERERMDFVNENLGIDDTCWIRFNPDEHDFDMSKVIGRIYRKIEEIKQEKYVKLLDEKKENEIKEEEYIDDHDYDKDIKELEKLTFKSIRQICREREIIQLGNKRDMINRIIETNKNIRKTERIENYLKIKQKEIEEREKEKEYIYQYNIKGAFVKKYENLKDASKDTKIDENEIKDALELVSSKAGNYIWRKSETEFTKPELIEINRKNEVNIIKMDTNGNIVKKYNSIKEAVDDDQKLSRGIVDRLVLNGKVFNGFIYKLPNKDNKIKHLTSKEKEEILLKNKNGKTSAELALEYNKSPKTISRFICKERKKS
jgi:very-short-patch-repair endonuclease/prophage antirepressor-like protein